MFAGTEKAVDKVLMIPAEQKTCSAQAFRLNEELIAAETKSVTARVNRYTQPASTCSKWREHAPEYSRI